ncbi:Cupin superfamily protein [Seminavis robusta]|uniref:Bifunctional lysine-specific demethylase and histidyl-hydroxylase n=1 Tax=Seminavis robusta TaxID=568900 RepID=A0A9N8DA22_9STRA|nr:Cupin superfamily protein [Seminavis robusta]|eukprot:Sro30_g019640.1 Cupin superfamily protein (585) ;mRNA; r:82525-84279
MSAFLVPSSSSCWSPLFFLIATASLFCFHQDASVQGFISPSSSLKPKRSPTPFIPSVASTKDNEKVATTTSQEYTIETVKGPFQPAKIAHVWGRQPILIRHAFDASTLLSDNTWPAWEDMISWATAGAAEEEDEPYYSQDEESIDTKEEDDDNFQFHDEEDLFFQYEDDEDDGVSSSPSDSVLSRLIRQKDTERLDSYSLELGPFSREYLHNLIYNNTTDDNKTKKDAWTLVLNDVDRVHSALLSWMNQIFDHTWLPRWRRDDGQISMAQKGGGIGPHVDNYDVFLIQTSGTRQWVLGASSFDEKLTAQQEMDALIPGLDVRILDLPQQQQYCAIQMNPGDMLYLPPRVVHCGTALSDDCMTLSVGCRAPSASELVSRVAEKVAYSLSETAVKRYTDFNLLHQEDESATSNATTSSHGASITPDVKHRMKQLVRDAVDEILDHDLLWDEIVGCLATEPKRPLWLEEPQCDREENESEIDQDIQHVLSGVGTLCLVEGVSVATSIVDSNNEGLVPTYRVFAAGQLFAWKGSDQNEPVSQAILSCLASGEPLTKQSLGETKVVPPEALTVLADLMSQGYLYFQVDD